jgi:hypothetical protein
LYIIVAPLPIGVINSTSNPLARGDKIGLLNTLIENLTILTVEKPPFIKKMLESKNACHILLKVALLETSSEFSKLSRGSLRIVI